MRTLKVVLFTVIATRYCCFAVWKCTDLSTGGTTPQPTTTKGAMEDSYECKDKLDLLLIEAVSAKDAQEYDLFEYPYGVGATDNLPVDYVQLNEVIMTKFNWPNGTYKGEPMAEAKRRVKAEPPLTMFTQARLVCLIHNKIGYYEAVIYTEPLPIQFPDIENCQPSDLLLPIRNYASDAYEFVNNSTKQIEMNLTIKNVGVALNDMRKDFYGVPLHIVLGELQDWAARDNTYEISIAKPLKNRFAKYVGGKTKLEWKEVEHGFHGMLHDKKMVIEYDRFKADAGTIQMHFQVVGQCGGYTVYTSWHQGRQFDLNGNCMDPPAGFSGDIELCDRCQVLPTCHEDINDWSKNYPGYLI